MGADTKDFSDHIIFLPSRRAMRSVEKLFVDKIGSAVLLPTLVPLGEGAEDEQDQDELPEVISNQERILILAKLLTADPNVRTFSNALPIARDLVRMQDYLENEGIDSGQIDWVQLVDEKYAAHFQQKAKFLDIVTTVLPSMLNNQVTQSKRRNDDIRAWGKSLDKYKKIIVCGSTASVPATADLMVHIANLDNGYILLPGKICGSERDFLLDTNPYNAEYKFLKRIGLEPTDVTVIHTGDSDIDFYNFAFSNTGGRYTGRGHGQLIECARESEEADVVAEIARQAMIENKTVLVITPDAAGNQRIAQALDRCGLSADFSGGQSGTMTKTGRAILNLFDDWIEAKDQSFEMTYKKYDYDLFQTLIKIIEERKDTFAPQFEFDGDDAVAIWDALKEVSDALGRNGIILTVADARAILADTIGGISIRPPMIEDAKIAVLGTIESRMQTADVVLLTGLNEGMFPARGYENAWLPRSMAESIGLPSPDRKVSLMALDFMNLSCASEVYWLRSLTAGSSQTTESRFLSRVDVAAGGIDKGNASKLLTTVRKRDVVDNQPLDYSAPRPPADKTDVYVTELELLTHNPYAFYVRHILRLRPLDDYWTDADARDFGNLVHHIIENAMGKNVDQIIAELDAGARQILPAGSIIFYFWHKRFIEIAPAIVQMLENSAGGAVEIKGSVKIAGRTVHARADRVWDGVVMDIKTGAAPNKKQLEEGNMPQLPLEGYMLQKSGFAIDTTSKSQAPSLQFLQLQNNKVRLIEYAGELAQRMIDGAVEKMTQLFGQYGKDFEPYEYHETSDPKYKAYDDLARIND